MLQSHVEGNVDEVLLGGGGRTRKIKQRVNTESGEASLAASFGNGLGGLAGNNWGRMVRSSSAEANKKGSRDSRGDDQGGREEGKEDNLPLA